jgi:hypothetical protein
MSASEILPALRDDGVGMLAPGYAAVAAGQ